ncbi:hypothetical protein Mal64_10560 [Pseudobythopirellula maris]|uniref:Uncharacterized protein n=1 Tax=Pseudobythopirellula maris TaxID=2527991 RepID=A0A5C5ZUU2_9BACT|nr:hypothetical protein [Pseudobythopirellula maris]TWT90661.1 hypothetical protein Mal64_10560 [Pseudobythopirellula maris]
MSVPSDEMLYVGFCRVCGTGPLGLRLCGGCGALVILCDECDAVWTTADTSAPPAFSDEPELPCPHCEASLVDAPSRWATREEVASCDWLASAIDAGELSLESGKPFEPNADEEIDG